MHRFDRRQRARFVERGKQQAPGIAVQLPQRIQLGHRPGKAHEMRHIRRDIPRDGGEDIASATDNQRVEAVLARQPHRCFQHAVDVLAPRE
ncbi:hypothetical protein IP83_04950 [Novosphingobium sp. AAP93]|nr:hypothetical protein IP83_04950 [Novosphingobium sp. AAP93]